MKLTLDQLDMLETMGEHGGISEHSFRLTFTKEEEHWALGMGYLERKRGGVYWLTKAGYDALEAATKKPFRRA